MQFDNNALKAALRAIKYEVVTATPKQQQAWLDQLVPGQRTASPAHVKVLQSQIKAGEYRAHGQPIQFDTEGRLLDGMHRLMAFSGLGLTATFIVARNVPVESFMAIDQHRARRASQFIAQQELRGSATWVASATDLVRAYRESDGAMEDVRKLTKFTQQQTIDFYASDIAPVLRANDWMIPAAREAGSTARISRAHNLALLVIAAQLSSSTRDTAMEWAKGLATGASLALTDPRLIVRNTFLSWGDALNGQAFKQPVWTFMVASWNAYAAGNWEAFAARNLAEMMEARRRAHDRTRRSIIVQNFPLPELVEAAPEPPRRRRRAAASE